MAFDKMDGLAQDAVEDAYVLAVPLDDQLDFTAAERNKELHCWAHPHIIACWVGNWLVSCEKVGDEWDCGVAHESELD